MKKWIGLFLIIILWACKNPLEDFALSFKIPLNDGLNTFTLRQYGAQTLPQKDFSLKTFGPKKSFLVNHLGNNTLSTNEDGRIVIAISKEFDFEKQKSFNFNLKFSTKGFTSKFYNFSKVNRANYSTTTYLASKTKTEGGVWGDSLLITDKRTWEKELINEYKEPLATIKIAENTNWQTDETYSLPLEINFVHFKTRNYLPGGGTITRYYDQNGTLQTKALEIKDFASMVYFQAADNQGQILTISDKPILIDFDLSKSINPLSGQLWSVNDSLDVLHHQEETNTWTKLKKVKINLINGKKMASTIGFQTGSYILAKTSSLCSSGPNFKVESAYQGIDILYLYRINDLQGKTLRSGYVSINNNTTFGLNYFPETTGFIKLSLFAYNNFYGGNSTDPIYVSNSLGSCAVSNHTIPLKLADHPLPVEVSLKLVCPSGKSIGNDLLKTQIRTQISEPGKNQWIDLLVFTFENPKITTYKIRKGSFYDFRISTDGGNSWPFLQSNYKIKEQKWTLDVKAEGYCK